MRITLSVIDGPHKGQVFTFVGHDTFLVGRSKRCHFRLASKDRYISRTQFLIEVNPPQCRLMDMDSRNGTYVNNQKVEEALLKDGDLIRAGKTMLRVKVEAKDGPAPPSPAPPTTDDAANRPESREAVTLPEVNVGKLEPRPIAVPVAPERAPAPPPPIPPLPPPSPPRAPAPPPSVPVARSTPSVPPAQAAPRPATTPPAAIVLPAPPPPPPVPARGEESSVVVAQPLCRACDAALGPGSWNGLCAQCVSQSQQYEQIIDGYQILRALGKGAMGIVYLAVRQADGSLVALKTIIPQVAGTPNQVERFLREADILRQLNHPNIVSFRESGESNGKIFFAMDYVNGRDAGEILRLEGAMPMARGCRIVCQLLEALDFAHARGFVHRDIKPSNMLVAAHGGRETMKLADFGLARVYQSSQLSGLTMTGDIGGTVAFMPPEQITQYREAKPPVDQYAAAATLYNLLTAHYIYTLPNSFQKQLAMILNENPVPIRMRRPELPDALAQVIHRALAREVSERYPSVRDFHTALSPFAR